jgi:hypothetical protein
MNWKTLATEVATGMVLLVAFLVVWEGYHHFQGDTPSKKTQAKSQLEVMIRKLDKAHEEMKYGKDIFAEISLESQVDPWGNKLICDFMKGEKKNVLELRSAGPDGLPYTDDDIVVKKEYVKDQTTLSKRVEAGVESFMRGLTRGSVGGAREGMREGGSTSDSKK